MHIITNQANEGTAKINKKDMRSENRKFYIATEGTEKLNNNPYVLKLIVSPLSEENIG